jgi:hypothetical protein
MLPIRSGQKLLPGEPVFKTPPLWIHESIAAKLFQAGKEIPVFSRRESKRRALLKLLDRIALRPTQKKGSEQLFRAPRAPDPAVPKKLF